ncbi:MAG: DUF1573 domain-containing protein [Bacteroidales bacterium]|jgi:hypothetical protein|nr:DUF1573 domain-containing protein [Bacteroidales bacterium]MDY0252933.1 DUF1573 domain-containing protein [Tenuifilaceae bacterium]
MKTILYSIIGLLITASTFAQQPGDEEIKKSNAFLRFNPSEVNMGTILVDDVNENTGNIEIEVHNDGAVPLILNQVTACCGTRVTDWPRQPIAPKQKGTIKVHFRVSPTPHRISRTVTVQSNAGNGNVQKVAILGEVALPKAQNEIRLP